MQNFHIQLTPTNTDHLLNAISVHFSSYPNYNLKYIGLTGNNYDHTGSIAKLLEVYKEVKVLYGESKRDDYLLKNLRKKENKYPIIKEGNEDEFEFYNILRPIFAFGNPPGK